MTIQRVVTMTGALLTAVALYSQTGVPAETTPAFPASERLHVLFISPPHRYDGVAAAQCTLLESLSNVRFSAIQVPHNGGDHIADVDGHFGKNERWIPIRKAEILRQLQRRWDAVIVAETKGVDDEIHETLANHVLRGGALVWMAGDQAPSWLAKALEGKPPAPEPVLSPLADIGLTAAGIRPVRRGKLLTGSCQRSLRVRISGESREEAVTVNLCDEHCGLLELRSKRRFPCVGYHDSV